jgi:Tfp pilus assembly protein PilP
LCVVVRYFIMKVKIKFEVELPEVEHTKEQLEEFIRFQFRDNGVMKRNNPFDSRVKSCDPIFGTFEWEYTDVEWDKVLDD